MSLCLTFSSFLIKLVRITKIFKILELDDKLCTCITYTYTHACACLFSRPFLLFYPFHFLFFSFSPLLLPPFLTLSLFLPFDSCFLTFSSLYSHFHAHNARVCICVKFKIFFLNCVYIF